MARARLRLNCGKVVIFACEDTVAPAAARPRTPGGANLKAERRNWDARWDDLARNWGAKFREPLKMLPGAKELIGRINSRAGQRSRCAARSAGRKSRHVRLRSALEGRKSAPLACVCASMIANGSLIPSD